MNLIFPVTVIDNFFSDPDSIRKYALSLDFNSKGRYPGKRTNNLGDINPKFIKKFGGMLLSTFFDLKEGSVNLKINVDFQLSEEKYEEGWVHEDKSVENYQFAGVVYLTPDAPINSGTSIYRKLKDIDYKNFNVRDQFYLDRDLDLSKYRKIRDTHNSNFEKTLDIGNVYNRLVIYNSLEFHKENILFGTDKDNARLTLVFFGSIELLNGSVSPIEKIKNYEKTFKEQT
jgi:hypothetical protein